MKAVLVGESWGKSESLFKHPLVGASGRELTLQAGFAKLMPYMKIQCRKCTIISPFIGTHCPTCGEFLWPNEFNLVDHWKKMRAEHQIAVTNVFNVQPPSNDVGHFFGTDIETEMPGWKASRTTGGSHLKAEHFHHVKRLWTEIETLKPNLIIALGNAACWATISQTKITTLRGTVSRSERLNIKVLPTFHPAAILRQPSMRPTVIADLTKASREIEFPEIRRTERWINLLDPTPESIRFGYEWFKRPAVAYANDIETSNGQITIIGFARSPDDILVIVFRDMRNEFGTGINYWPTKELEIEAWKLAIYGLRTPQVKIFQNGLYDLSYYIRMGIHPVNATEDTMLWHHSLYPELPKSLGYLGSLYSNEISWKLMRRSNTLKRDE